MNRVPTKRNPNQIDTRLLPSNDVCKKTVKSYLNNSRLVSTEFCWGKQGTALCLLLDRKVGKRHPLVTLLEDASREDHIGQSCLKTYAEQSDGPPRAGGLDVVGTE